ncbi:hypothetical protein BDZ89DRAFT_1177300 [Hymenopellis radicata]|nr:hypothetical protein BDZ89DRAFT_1177300 [Hymenopellis radicata]
MRWRDRMVTEWKEALEKVKKNEEVLQRKRKREAEMDAADLERERHMEELDSAARYAVTPNQRNVRIDNELAVQVERTKAKRKRPVVEEEENDDSDDSDSEDVHEADDGDDEG